MNLTDRRHWEKILVAVCCAVIISVIVLFAIGPDTGFSAGTCGLETMPINYSMDIQPSFEESLLYEYGEREPDRNLTLPPLQQYPEHKALIDTLMGQAGVTGSPDSVIGLFEFPDARLILIDRNTSVTEVIVTGDKARTVNLTLALVGSRHYQTEKSWNPKRGTYNFSSENSVTITRLDIVDPHPGNATVPLYIVNKTETEQDFYPNGRSLATITTSGTFYVLYGQRVERVTGTTAVVLDPSWKQCISSFETSGSGSSTGSVTQTLKFARSSERMLWSRSIGTSAYLQVYDAAMGGTSSSQWKSRDSSGCTC